jgi:hypothetical protein
MTDSDFDPRFGATAFRRDSLFGLASIKKNWAEGHTDVAALLQPPIFAPISMMVFAKKPLDFIV